MVPPMLAALTIALFTLTPLLGSSASPHWPMPGYVATFPLLGERLAIAARSRRWPRAWLAAPALLGPVRRCRRIRRRHGALGAAFPKPLQAATRRGGVDRMDRRSHRTGAARRVATIVPRGGRRPVERGGQAGRGAGDRATVVVFSSDPPRVPPAPGQRRPGRPRRPDPRPRRRLETPVPPALADLFPEHKVGAAHCRRTRGPRGDRRRRGRGASPSRPYPQRFRRLDVVRTGSSARPSRACNRSRNCSGGDIRCIDRTAGRRRDRSPVKGRSRPRATRPVG